MTAPRKSAKTNEPSAAVLAGRQALAAALVARLTQSRLSWKFGNASLDVGGKVFAFTTRAGNVTMKLPEERIQGLIESGQALPLIMGKRVMREWVNVPEPASDATFDLLEEAMVFVASLPAPKPRRKAAASATVKKPTASKAAKRRP